MRTHQQVSTRSVLHSMQSDQSFTVKQRVVAAAAVLCGDATRQFTMPATERSLEKISYLSSIPPFECGFVMQELIDKGWYELITREGGRRHWVVAKPRFDALIAAKQQPAEARPGEQP